MVLVGFLSLLDLCGNLILSSDFSLSELLVELHFSLFDIDDLFELNFEDLPLDQIVVSLSFGLHILCFEVIGFVSLEFEDFLELLNSSNLILSFLLGS